jgi:sugar lactone lactonase YvrE
VTLSGVNAPSDMAVVGSDAYVTSESNNCIYKVNLATGAGTVFAGTSGNNGYAEGSGAAARFFFPKGIVFDAKSNTLYVADSGNNRIRMIKLDGTVSTFAGSGAGQALDGTGTAAAFKSPYDITTDGAGNFFVADYAANKIRRITASGDVTTIAGSGTLASTDGTGDQASFKFPGSIAYGKVGGTDALFVAESSGTIRVVSGW